MELVTTPRTIPTLTFNAGLDNIIETILRATRKRTTVKPYLVTLHGLPNSGKSTFGRRARDILYKFYGREGIVVMTDDENHSLIHRHARDFLFIEDQPGVTSVMRYSQQLYNRSPDKYILLTTSLDLPDIPYDLLSSPYDLVIVNPEAQVKSRCKNF